MVKKILIESGRGNDILYLTDNLAFLRALLAKGEKAAAILTEENRHEDFTGLPYAVEQIEEMEPEDFVRLYRRLAGLPWEILETKRCRLREMTVSDVDWLYEIYADASITEFMEDLYEDREQERRYMEEYRKYIYEFYGYGIWIVEEKTSGLVMGRAGVEPKDGEVELGFLIARPWQRLGYGYEVCSAILEYVRREIECERVLSRVHPGNRASVGLLEKLGFSKLKGADGAELETWVLPMEKKKEPHPCEDRVLESSS